MCRYWVPKSVGYYPIYKLLKKRQAIKGTAREEIFKNPYIGKGIRQVRSKLTRKEYSPLEIAKALHYVDQHREDCEKSPKYFNRFCHRLLLLVNFMAEMRHYLKFNGNGKELLLHFCGQYRSSHEKLVSIIGGNQQRDLREYRLKIRRKHRWYPYNNHYFSTPPESDDSSSSDSDTGVPRRDPANYFCVEGSYDPAIVKQIGDDNVDRYT